jgi:hypothetical protein
MPLILVMRSLRQCNFSILQRFIFLFFLGLFLASILSLYELHFTYNQGKNLSPCPYNIVVFSISPFPQGTSRHKNALEVIYYNSLLSCEKCQEILSETNLNKYLYQSATFLPQLHIYSHLLNRNMSTFGGITCVQNSSTYALSFIELPT